MTWRVFLNLGLSKTTNIPSTLLKNLDRPELLCGIESLIRKLLSERTDNIAQRNWLFQSPAQHNCASQPTKYSCHCRSVIYLLGQRPSHYQNTYNMSKQRRLSYLIPMPVVVRYLLHQAISPQRALSHWLCAMHDLWRCPEMLLSSHIESVTHLAREPGFIRSRCIYCHNSSRSVPPKRGQR